jgi:hypothetical protein
MTNVLTLAAAIAVLTTSMARGADQEAAPPMTSEDHAAAASAYDAEAKEAKQKAASHDLMASRYRNAPASQKGLNVPTTPMANHCEKLADSYEQVAGEASALADLHRAAASDPVAK